MSSFPAKSLNTDYLPNEQKTSRKNPGTISFFIILTLLWKHLAVFYQQKAPIRLEEKINLKVAHSLRLSVASELCVEPSNYLHLGR